MLNKDTEKQTDTELWKQYKARPTPENRAKLLKRFEGTIYKQVHKWEGPVASDVLVNEAKLLACKAFDSYNPNMGTSLLTHVTNGLMPLSRKVYTFQNTARIPENVILKLNKYQQAVDEFKQLEGRDPTTNELHGKLGWKPADIQRVRDYSIRNLVESGPEVSGSFYNRGVQEDIDESVLSGLYMGFDPTDKKIFEYSTGYNNKPVLSLDQLAKKLGMTKPQITYRKQLIRKQVEDYMNRPSLRRRYGK